MNLKGVILGVTGALAASGAYAADLPAAPEPVDYVRVCDAFGTGYFYIPGSETCIRISGLVRVEYSTNFISDDNSGEFAGMSWDNPRLPGYNFYARGRLNVDTRTNTEFGLLRSFFRYDLTKQTTNGTGTSSNLAYALVQFGGLTVGYTDSYFTGIYVPTMGNILETSQPDYATILAAYTFSFMEGFSATLSIEDQTYSRANIAGPVQPNGKGGPNVQNAEASMPDIVLSLNADQGWGSAKLMGILHEVQTVGTGNRARGTAVASQSDLGWGIGAGAAINLPMLAEGDQFTILGVYTQGYAAGVLNSSWDARVTRTGDLELSNNWAINAGFLHFWTPQISSALAGSYLDVSNMARNNFNRWDVQGDLAYTPVDGLTFAGELAYAIVDPDQGKNTDALIGTIRVERSF